MIIYKILRSKEFERFQKDGEFHGAPVDIADGFIHFSTREQAPETAHKHFYGETGLVILACDADNWTDALKWEVSRGGALFPHLYDILRISDVLWHAPLPWENDRHIFSDKEHRA